MKSKETQKLWIKCNEEAKCVIIIIITLEIILGLHSQTELENSLALKSSIFLGQKIPFYSISRYKKEIVIVALQSLKVFISITENSMKIRI